MATLKKSYIYKASRHGVYLGIIPDVTSPFYYSQKINTSHCQLTIVVQRSPDLARESVDTLATESGDDITTESGDLIALERQPDIVGNSNSQALIRNGNDIEVYEITDTYPTGKLVFSGFISTWTADFSKNVIRATILSNGIELDNTLIGGGEVSDQSQVVQNTSILLYDRFSPKNSGWQKVGQSFTVGAGVTNISAIKVRLAAQNASIPARVILKIDSVYTDYYFVPELARVERIITSTSAADYVFTLPTPLTVTPGQQYFFAIQCTGESGYGCYAYYQNTNIYAGGQMFNDEYSGSGSPVYMQPTPYSGIATASDLYFVTYDTASDSSVPYTADDPADIVRAVMDIYNAAGGVITYTASSIENTGTSVNYTFKLATVLEGITKAAELAPGTWYWFVDPATGVLNFKEVNTTADHTFIKGRHITDPLEITASIENVINDVRFSGGDVGGGVNLYKVLTDETSQSEFKVGLQRISDGRVILDATATAMMQNVLDSSADEQYQTVITILDTTYDLSTVDLGETVGFAGFGNFVDSLILQIVGKSRAANSLTMGLGVLPKRPTEAIAAILRALNDLQTIDNPSQPS